MKKIAAFSLCIMFVGAFAGTCFSSSDSPETPLSGPVRPSRLDLSFKEHEPVVEARHVTILDEPRAKSMPESREPVFSVDGLVRFTWYTAPTILGAAVGGSYAGPAGAGLFGSFCAGCAHFVAKDVFKDDEG